MDNDMGLLATIFILLAFMFGVYLFASSMESKTFNRLTGSNTTMWDAMFTELRVMEGVKK